MKTYLISALSGLTALAVLGSCAVTDQLAQSSEYDDMYFTANDRDLVEVTELNELSKAEYDNSGSYVFDEEGYSSKSVNPDVLAQYQNDDRQKAEEEADYYVEEQDREPMVVNNFYGPYGRRYSTFGNSFYNDPFNDPFYGAHSYSPFRNSYYDPFWGPASRFRPGIRFGLSLGFGNAWGYRPYSPWGWGNSYAYDPFYSSYYDPFYNPYHSYGYGYGYGFGYGRPNVVIINNNDGLITRRPVQGRVPMNVTRANQNANTRTVAGRAGTTDRASATRTTRSSYGTQTGKNTPQFGSRNSIYSDQRREANRSVYSSSRQRSNSAAFSGRNSSSGRYSSSTREGYNSRGSRNSSPSYDRGSFGGSNNRSGSFSNSGSSGGSRSGSYSSGSSGGSSRPSGSRGRGGN